MKLDAFEELFSNFDDEYLKFERVSNKRSGRPDLHAFIILDELVPGTEDVVSCSEHDEFFLSISPEVLAGVISEEQVVDLIRCGIRYDSHLYSLAVYS